MNNNKNGFTLVELAIALMVIGLLIGGVLKGQELIENAKIIATIKQINDYDTAVMIFYSTYNALPGDIQKAALLLPDCKTDPCQLAGNNDGVISPTFAKESLNVWWHLQKAGLIRNINEESTYDFSISPYTPYGVGNHILLKSASTYVAPDGFPTHSLNENYFSFYGPAHESAVWLKKLDMKLDDGKAYSGKVQLMKIATRPACFDITTLDYLDNKTLKCQVKITSNSAN